PLVRERVFFKDGRGRFFYIRQVEESGPVLRGLTVYDASDASAPVLLVARSGRVARGGGWSLEDGILYRMDAEGFVAQEVRFATFRLEVDERLDVFLGEQKTTLEMTRRELAETIALFRRGGVDVTPLVVDYHLKLALPWTNLVFALLVLGQAAYLPTPRQEKRLWGLGVVTALAFLYYLAAAVARSLGVHGRLAPATAAWLAPVGFSLLGLAGLGHEPPGGGGRRRKGVLLAALFLLALALLAAGRYGLERAKAAELPEERAPAAEAVPEDPAEPSGIDQGPDSEAAATGSGEVESEPKEPLRLTAERVFYRSDKVLEARGRVRIAYGEVELEAEEVQVDTEQEVLYAAGAVKVTRGEDALAGEDFVYRLREKSWALRLPSGRVRSRRIVGEAFLRAEEVEQPAGTDDFLFRRGSATTCDQPEPHYHIEGERIEYYPGDKVVIRPATYYEGRVALFTLPVLVIYLGEEDRRFYPTVGYNERDGFFILTAYHFLVEPKVTGILLADWFQKRGMAGGVEWRLRPGPEQQGKFLFYQKEGQWGQKDLRLQGSWEAGPPQDRLTA
ncbi:MAG: LptF/LptG family permease, partial [Bacillota bacterium]|nr:LptF/LptG family permease [Bacillota bacterium]